jgi:hypothetical protein
MSGTTLGFGVTIIVFQPCRGDTAWINQSVSFFGPDSASQQVAHTQVTPFQGLAGACEYRHPRALPWAGIWCPFGAVD